MNVSWRVPALVILALVCLTPAPLLAEIRPGAFTLSPMAGSYYFDSEETLERRPVYTLGLGYNSSEHWAKELVLGYAETRPEALTDAHINVYTAHLDLLYHFTPRDPATFYFAMGVGGIQYEPRGKYENIIPKDEDLLLNYGLGLKASINDTASFRFDARHKITTQDEHFHDKELNHFSYTAGLYMQFGGEKGERKELDSDGDGIVDALDRCPDTLPGVTVDNDGCPKDTDGDGVADDLDRCPGTPAGTLVNNTGCPVEEAPADSDGDGVVDKRDRCPDTPEGTEVDYKGCPVVVVSDADGDGIEDKADKCPNTPSNIPVNSFGCPMDSDKDGIFDFEDDCPDTPAGKMVDPRGCAVKEADVPVELAVTFAPNSSTVKSAPKSELQRAKALLEANPTASLIVEGHTDSTGSEAYNLKLSQRRAESVRKHIISTLGIAPSRVIAKGYGESKPIADNASQEGRLKNRRVTIRYEK